MTLLIDGHNLIPNLPGLSLRDLEDEERLIQWLQSYAGSRRKTLHVYFDGAPPGKSGARSFGRVTAHFVIQGSTADEAIRQHLVRLGRAARNWSVVSSDRRVQAEARALGAQVIPSAEFARELVKVSTTPPTRKHSDAPLSPAEVDEWLRLFQNQKKNDP